MTGGDNCSALGCQGGRMVWVHASSSSCLGCSFLYSRFRNEIAALLSLAVGHFQNYQQEPCQSHVHEEPQAHHYHHHCINCKYRALKSGLTTGKCHQHVAVACMLGVVLALKQMLRWLYGRYGEKSIVPGSFSYLRQQEKLSRQLCLACKNLRH